MSALAQAQCKYDRLMPEDFDVDAEDWVPAALPSLTDGQIEEFISGVADTGAYEDELGATKKASDIHHAVARQWVKDKGTIPGNIGPAFWRWAKAKAYLAMFGKP